MNELTINIIYRISLTLKNKVRTMSEASKNHHKILLERIQRHLRCVGISNEMFLLDIEVLTSSILKEVKA